MKHKYFGTVESEVFLKLNDNEKSVFLKENKLAQDVLGMRSDKFEKTDEKGGFILRTFFCTDDLRQEFSTSLKQEVYLFLNKFHQSLIETNIMLLNRDLESKTYGFSKKKIKKHALKSFNKIYFEIVDENEVSLGKNVNGEIGAAKRFTQLQGRQLFLIDSLGKDENIVTNYLFGNQDYFNRELFETNIKVLEIFEFENKLAQLLFLNRKFQFEEENIFTPKTISQNIYENYPEDFHSLKQLEFIEEQLSFATNKNPSYIFSLFSYFQNEINLKIPKEIIFREVINHYFDLNLGRLKASDSSSNAHQNRLKSIKKYWLEF